MPRIIFKMGHVCPNCDEITTVVGPECRCIHCGFKLKTFDEVDWYDDRD